MVFECIDSYCHHNCGESSVVRAPGQVASAVQSYSDSAGNSLSYGDLQPHCPLDAPHCKAESTSLDAEFLLENPRGQLESRIDYFARTSVESHIALAFPGLGDVWDSTRRNHPSTSLLHTSAVGQGTLRQDYPADHFQYDNARAHRYGQRLEQLLAAETALAELSGRWQNDEGTLNCDSFAQLNSFRSSGAFLSALLH